MANRLRVNYVTPLPPQPTEVANHAAVVLRALGPMADVTAWSGDEAAGLNAAVTLRRFSAHNVPAWALAAADVTFYNIGNNARFHAGIWQASRRVPGVVVLHDTCLQNLFAGFSMTPSGTADYIAMMQRFHGKEGGAAALSLVRGQRDILDMITRFPMTQAAIDDCLGVVVHNASDLPRIRGLVRAPVWFVPLAYDAGAIRAPAPRPHARQDPVRLIVFGHIGPNRCLLQIIEALADPRIRHAVRLDVYGQVGDAASAHAAIERHDLRGVVALHGHVPEAALNEALAAAALALNLRNPTAGEASASQLRIWANGLPSLVSQTGWYGALPQDTVHFVRPGQEVADVISHLLAYMDDPAPYRAAGLAGSVHLQQTHSAQAYAEALAAIGEELRAPRLLAVSESRLPASGGPAIEGNVEAITGDTLFGWAAVEGRSDARVLIRLFLGAELIAETVADDFRDDLKLAGKGDGWSGFMLRLPLAARAGRSEPLSVTACWDNRQLLLHRDERTWNDAPAEAARTGLLYLDVTDLLIYSTTSRTVSGIQRVQLGYIANWCRDADRKALLRFVLFSVQHRRFFEFDAEDFAWLLACLSAPDDDFAARRARLTLINSAESLTPFAPGQGDTLLVTGNFWSFPHFHRSLRQLQADTGLHYVQLYYDAVPTSVPETCPPEASQTYNRALARMLDQADAVVAISCFSAGELRLLASRLSLPCPQIEIVPLGTEARYGAEIADDSDLPEGLGDFVLCVGTIEPRKNHLYLFRLWQRLLQTRGGRLTPKLVCAGRFGWLTDGLQRHLHAHGNLDGHFITLAEVTDATLRALYRNCRFTIYPSIYEGWGLPVSESLSAGRLCVTSNVTAMPEAGGQWCDYLDPFDLSSGYDAVTRLLDEPGLVEQKEAVIRESFRATSWAAASDQLWGALERIAHQAGVRQRRLYRPPVLAMGDRFALPPPLLPLDTPVAVARNEVCVAGFEQILVGPDWHQTEPWGAWARGCVARLLFRTEHAGEDGIVGYFRVGLPDTSVGHTCRVDVNGVSVRQAALTPGCQTICVDLGSGGYMRVDLVVDREVAVPGDSRQLRLGLHGVFVCRQSDYAARLAFLEQGG